MYGDQLQFLVDYQHGNCQPLLKEILKSHFSEGKNPFNGIVMFDVDVLNPKTLFSNVSGRPWTMVNVLDTDSKARDIAFLDNYAMSRWRCVLHYMVGAGAIKGPDGETISPDAVRILLNANLMKRDENDGSPVITRQGFQFLLLDTQAQVWHFMLQYLDSCEQRGMSLPECLSMMFQLSFSTLGRDYSSEGLSNTLLSFLQHLREFGLVYQRKVGTNCNLYCMALIFYILEKGRSILPHTISA